eukprot:62443_1
MSEEQRKRFYLRNKDEIQPVIIPSFVKQQNKEIRDKEKDPKNVVKIAILNYRYTNSKKVQHELRMVKAYKMGDKGRRVRQTTSGGILFGGGDVSEYAQKQALDRIEKDKYQNNRQHVIIDATTMKRMDDWNRFTELDDVDVAV